MTNLGKYLIALALVLGVVGVGLGVVSFSAHTGGTFGATGNASTVSPNPEWFSGGLQIGQTGTLNTNYQFGTCNTTFYGTSLAATSTGTFVCAVSGIQAQDFILADLPQTEAGGTVGGFVIENAYSTTTGIVAFTYLNFTGAATSSFKQATTSVEYFGWR